MSIVKVLNDQNINNILNYINENIYSTNDLCRFCEEEDKMFDHLVNSWGAPASILIDATYTSIAPSSSYVDFVLQYGCLRSQIKLN